MQKVIQCEFVPREVFSKSELYKKSFDASIDRLDELVVETAKSLPEVYQKGFESTAVAFENKEEDGSVRYSTKAYSSGKFDEGRSVISIVARPCTINFRLKGSVYVPKATVLFSYQTDEQAKDVIKSFIPEFLYDATGFEDGFRSAVAIKSVGDDGVINKGIRTLHILGLDDQVDSVIMEAGASLVPCDLANNGRSAYAVLGSECQIREFPVGGLETFLKKGYVALVQMFRSDKK